MFANVDGFAVVIFERRARTPRRVVIDATRRQRREHHLKLVKHRLAAFLLRLRDGVHGQHRVAQGRLHPQLLKHGVHVARRARVFQTDVPSRLFGNPPGNCSHSFRSVSPRKCRLASVSVVSSMQSSSRAARCARSANAASRVEGVEHVAVRCSSRTSTSSDPIDPTPPVRDGVGVGVRARLRRRARAGVAKHLLGRLQHRHRLREETSEQ